MHPCRLSSIHLLQGWDFLVYSRVMKPVEIYTDGGCSGNPGPGGWGYVLLHDGREVRRSGGAPETTNNRMELTAVITALEDLSADQDLRQCPVNLYTDSQYVKNGITSWINTWLKNGWQTSAKKPVKNRDLWERLKNLQDALAISWHWVKGHAGNQYNEAADTMVRKEIDTFLK